MSDAAAPPPPKTQTPFKVAVLDDYQGASTAHFDALDARFITTTFRDTLPPWGHPDTPAEAREALVRRLEPFDAICTMRERTPFPRALVERLPNLRLLLTTGLRNASLDLNALRDAGIPVAGTADKSTGTQVGTNSTTEHCVSLILGVARNIARDDAAVKAGGWQTGLATGLTGKTLGVLGLGRLGLATARIMHLAFGMSVIAWSQNLTQAAADKSAASAGLPVEGPDGAKTFRVVSREELFSQSDVLSVHLVLSERSRGLVGASDLARMKKSAFLVNTSRGPLVDEKALLDALNRGVIAGAAVDVFDVEPLPANSPWRTTAWGEDGRSRVLLTPHMGYVEGNTLDAWYGQQVDNLRRWADGEVIINKLA
ncbi:D-3-phosphoglycerate dehydrogenase [Plectosphaerella cucumerina]|uniref:D-3-phosphoglycerate dehydrogenase n=1 Tax=Plectosphaerella cucumerina TaxID=40658 RepID=A0A8K0X3Z7_9PEZI|nr:D-3-phosphoglycerate dehydrogenase [Plectosphaerella cucumerina]